MEEVKKVEEVKEPERKWLRKIGTNLCFARTALQEAKGDMVPVTDEEMLKCREAQNAENKARAAVRMKSLEHPEVAVEDKKTQEPAPEKAEQVSAVPEPTEDQKRKGKVRKVKAEPASVLTPEGQAE
jgi:hypothetical protein